MRVSFKRRASPLVVFLLIAALATVAVYLIPSRQPLPGPSVEFALLDGGTLALDRLRGRPVLVNFWATSCAPCLRELPDLAQLYRELKPRGLELIAVAMAYDAPLNVRTYSQRQNFPFPVALDIGGRAAEAFGNIEFVPTTVLIDPHGDIVYRYTGALDLGRVRRMIVRLQDAPMP